MQQNFNDVSFRMWEEFSDNYSKHFSNNLSVFSLSLLNMMRINTATSILDAGCGTGYLHPYIVSKKQHHCKLTAFDFSSQMVKRAAARMKKFITQSEQGNLDQITQQELDQIQINDQIFESRLYELKVLDIEHLEVFPDASFDIYHSTLVLQLIQNPDQAMAEAYRVLKPGGKFGIAVWGSKSKCTSLGLISDSLIEADLAPDIASKNYIEDKSILVEKVKKHGFINILCWQQLIAQDILHEDDVIEFARPDTVKLLQSCPADNKIRYQQAINRRFAELKLLNEPFTFECVMLIAEKPE